MLQYSRRSIFNAESPLISMSIHNQIYDLEYLDARWIFRLTSISNVTTLWLSDA